MARYRCLVVGGGRIGAGFGWPEYPYVYTHAGAYAASDRCDLAGIVEPNPERFNWCGKRWGVHVYESLQAALADQPFEIASICTRPAQHLGILEELARADTIKRIWLEKPAAIGDRGYRAVLGNRLLNFVQVNYIRRFDPAHQRVAELIAGRPTVLTVWAKDEPETRCHFEDLARWWGSKLIYIDNTGQIPATNSYTVNYGPWAVEFRNGGVEGGFMERALDNLLDSLDTGAQLRSPLTPETP